MVVVLETEPDVDFSTSVFVDDYELIDSALLESKLGDTCTGVPGRLLGKPQFILRFMHLNILWKRLFSGLFRK